MNIPALANAQSTGIVDLALGSLRYAAVRSLSGEQLLALNRSAILDHGANESFEDAFDRNVDRIVLSRASEKGFEL